MPALGAEGLARLRALAPGLAGVWVGGCAGRGDGCFPRSRTLAHTHDRRDGGRDGEALSGWVCFRAGERRCWVGGKRALAVPVGERRPSQLMLHELAHVLTPGDRSHGRRWRAAARGLGLRGLRYAPGSVRAAARPAPGRWAVACPRAACGARRYRSAGAARRAAAVPCPRCGSRRVDLGALTPG